MLFVQNLRFAVRSIAGMKGLSTAIVLTLALGIGVNVAIFSLVRSVLLRPLVNRGEDRIVYLRQSAPGIGADVMLLLSQLHRGGATICLVTHDARFAEHAERVVKLLDGNLLREDGEANGANVRSAG